MDFTVLQTTQHFIGERDLMIEASYREHRDAEPLEFRLYLVGIIDRRLCLTTDVSWLDGSSVWLEFLAEAGRAGTRIVSFQAKVCRKVSLLGGLFNYHLEMVGVTSKKREELESLLEPLESQSGRIYYQHQFHGAENGILQLPSAAVELRSISCGGLSFVLDDPPQAGEVLDGSLSLDNSEFVCQLKVEEVSQKENSHYLCECTIRSFTDGRDKELRKLLEKKAHKVAVLVA